MIKKILAWPFLILIRFYQYGISAYFPSACRHQPTCSQYMKEAIEKYGVGRGMFLGVRRLMKCHPVGSWGYDPVPEKKRCACE